MALPADATELPERQQNILLWAIEYGKFSLQQLESLYPNQSRRTLQRDLKTLVDLGWSLWAKPTNVPISLQNQRQKIDRIADSGFGYPGGLGVG
jgi:hypothetical protein